MCDSPGRCNRKGTAAVTINMIGRDTAKLVFQVHAVDAAGNVVIRRKIQRNDLITFREA